MAVYYKFKSAKNDDFIPIDGHFISVAILKERIFESKHLGTGTDFDLVITNAQTHEEYLDGAMMIPKNTSVLIRRVPGRPRMPIVTQPDEPKIETTFKDDQSANNHFMATDSSVLKDVEASEWDDEFGNDLYATIPEVVPVQAGNPVQDAPVPSEADEDSKIKALIETPALDWQRQGADGFGGGRGFGRGGRMMAGRGFGRGAMECKTPPPGYVCHRCKIPGHFIQHCPTNGDPNYDIKKVKPPTGIPKSMLMTTSDGFYALPSGAVAVLKPNEAAFEKEIEGLPSTRSVGDLPPELHCPLCKEVMKDAVLTSKCCFKSFCDKCIRNYIMSKSMCVCGAANILADDLLPNKTLRDAINHILESNTNSAENAGSFVQVQDMESARDPQPKHPSPSQSAASNADQMQPRRLDEVSKPEDITNDEKLFGIPQQQTLEKGKIPMVPDICKATHESASAKEPASQGSALLAEEVVQQKLAAGEAGKKKKKKKQRLPVNDVPFFPAAEMQWRAPQDFAVDNYMMGMGPSAYNPFWGGVQPTMDPFMPPFAGPMPYNMGYGVGPLDMPPFGGMIPPDPFGGQGFMFPPIPPQRDLAELTMGFNIRPPLISREAFEARKAADQRRKHEIERRGESREMPRDRDPGREMSSGAGDVAALKPKPNRVQRAPSEDRYENDLNRDRGHRDGGDDRHRHQRSEAPPAERESDLPRPPSKRKSDHHSHSRQEERDRRRSHRSESSTNASSPAVDPPPVPSKTTSAATTAAAAEAERKQNASVFSRISFPEEESSERRKVPSLSYAEPKGMTIKEKKGVGGGGAGASSSSQYQNRTGASTTVDSANDGYGEESSDDDRQLKRRPSSDDDRHLKRRPSSDDDRHLKRRPSSYKPSPLPKHEEWEDGEDDVRQSRGSRERDRGSHNSSKHR